MKVEDQWPAEIAISNPDYLTITAPFGMDTYVLLTTETPISDLSVFTFEGARTRGGEQAGARGATNPLEDLIAHVNASTRGLRTRRCGADDLVGSAALDQERREALRSRTSGAASRSATTRRTSGRSGGEGPTSRRIAVALTGPVVSRETCHWSTYLPMPGVDGFRGYATNGGVAGIRLRVSANDSVGGARFSPGLIRIASDDAQQIAFDQTRRTPPDHVIRVQIPASQPNLQVLGFPRS